MMTLAAPVFGFCLWLFGFSAMTVTADVTAELTETEHSAIVVYLDNATK